jgi:hypothetical protein
VWNLGEYDNVVRRDLSIVSALPVGLGTTGYTVLKKGGETCLNDYTQGVLEGLAYARGLLRREKRSKASAKLAERILEIVDTDARDFEFRMQAVG